MYLHYRGCLWFVWAPAHAPSQYFPVLLRPLWLGRPLLPSLASQCVREVPRHLQKWALPLTSYKLLAGGHQRLSIATYGRTPSYLKHCWLADHRFVCPQVDTFSLEFLSLFCLVFVLDRYFPIKYYLHLCCYNPHQPFFLTISKPPTTPSFQSSLLAMLVSHKIYILRVGSCLTR
jgi:hypothetical protein